MTAFASRERYLWVATFGGGVTQIDRVSSRVVRMRAAGAEVGDDFALQASVQLSGAVLAEGLTSLQQMGPIN